MNSVWLAGVFDVIGEVKLVSHDGELWLKATMVSDCLKLLHAVRSNIDLGIVRRYLGGRSYEYILEGSEAAEFLESIRSHLMVRRRIVSATLASMNHS